jgi:mannose-1-phosphate guanylyltransferase
MVLSAQAKVFIQGLEDYIIVDQDDILMIIELPNGKLNELRSKPCQKHGDDIG